jgi:hypothetical protein
VICMATKYKMVVQLRKWPGVPLLEKMLELCCHLHIFLSLVLIIELTSLTMKIIHTYLKIFLDNITSI